MQTVSSTYFTVIKVPISFEAGEFLAVGLLMVDGDGVELRFSERKLKLLKDLISPDQMELARTRIRSLIQAQKQVRTELGGSYVPEEFSLSYLQYLSRYSNNILVFSEPVKIESKDGGLTEILYAKFVDAFEAPIKTKEKPIKQKVRARFSKKSVERLVWDFEITQDLLPAMPVVSIKSHFAGMGDGLVLGDSFDFQTPYHLLLAHLSPLQLVARSVAPGKLQKAYIIGKEPAKALEKNHKQWQMLRSSRYLEYVDLSETEKVEEYLEKQQVSPVDA